MTQVFDFTRRLHISRNHAHCSCGPCTECTYGTWMSYRMMHCKNLSKPPLARILKLGQTLSPTPPKDYELLHSQFPCPQASVRTPPITPLPSSIRLQRLQNYRIPSAAKSIASPAADISNPAPISPRPVSTSCADTSKAPAASCCACACAPGSLSSPT